MHQLLCFKSKFVTTLHSHLDVTCSYYFWSTCFNVHVNHSYIVKYCFSLHIFKNMVQYRQFGSCSFFSFIFLDDKMSSFSPSPAFEKKVHKIQEMFGYRYGIQARTGMSKVDIYRRSLLQSLASSMKILIHQMLQKQQLWLSFVIVRDCVSIVLITALQTRQRIQ